MVKIAPSILSADFSDMKNEIKKIGDSGADWVHLDVMDGHFVPNITFGPKMVRDIRQFTDLDFDAHLMISNPDQFIPLFAEAGADWITVHYEASVHLHRSLQLVRECGGRPGVSVVPSTPVSLLKDILPYVDQVLIMTVNPGFGGQKLIPECVGKISELANMRSQLNLDFLISVDGGINRHTVESVRSAGADVLISGSAFFAAKNKREEILFLKGQSIV